MQYVASVEIFQKIQLLSVFENTTFRGISKAHICSAVRAVVGYTFFISKFLTSLLMLKLFSTSKFIYLHMYILQPLLFNFLARIRALFWQTFLVLLSLQDIKKLTILMAHNLS